MSEAAWRPGGSNHVTSYSCVGCAICLLCKDLGSNPARRAKEPKAADSADVKFLQSAAPNKGLLAMAMEVGVLKPQSSLPKGSWAPIACTKPRRAPDALCQQSVIVWVGSKSLASHCFESPGGLPYIGTLGRTLNVGSWQCIAFSFGTPDIYIYIYIYELYIGAIHGLQTVVKLAVPSRGSLQRTFSTDL